MGLRKYVKVETVFWSVFPNIGFGLPFWRSKHQTQIQILQSQMMNGSSFPLTECGPWHGPWAHKGKPALGSIQIIRSVLADLLPYPPSDISCDSHLKQLMKTVPYVKLHFIQFSSGWKLTLKMFGLSECFPLGAKGLMMYNLSWRLYGRVSQSKHFFPLILYHPDKQKCWAI